MTELEATPSQPEAPAKKLSLLRRMYNWVVKYADSPKAIWALGSVSFAESSFFPIPPDALLIPMAASNPKKVWFYAHICVITSVLGGILGYYIGAALFDTIGAWIIWFFGAEEQFESLREEYNSGLGMIVLITKGLTPIPYKIVTILSGALSFPFHEFIIGSIIARSTRFYMLAVLLRYFGEEVRIWVEKNLVWAMIILVGAIVMTFVIVPYIL